MQSTPDVGERGAEIHGRLARTHAVKVAGLAREMFHARLWVTIVSLPTAVVASAVFGLDGAAWASLGLAALLVIAMYRVYLPGVVRVGTMGPAFGPPDPGLRRTDVQLGTPSAG